MYCIFTRVGTIGGSNAELSWLNLVGFFCLAISELVGPIISLHELTALSFSKTNAITVDLYVI
jgi:hypothetical protein